MFILLNGIVNIEPQNVALKWILPFSNSLKCAYAVKNIMNLNIWGILFNLNVEFDKTIIQRNIFI